jgi:uncharacterized delta-60 repeat protein
MEQPSVTFRDGFRSAAMTFRHWTARLCLTAFWPACLSAATLAERVDASFLPSLPTGLPSAISHLEVTDAGRIWVNGTHCLKPDGSGLEEFRSALHTGEFIYTLIYGTTAAPEGKLLVCGSFFHPTAGSGQLLRLNADGSIDGTFGIRRFTGHQFLALDVQVDVEGGRLLVGGSFYHSPPLFQQGVAVSDLAGEPVTAFNSYPGISSGFARVVRKAAEGKVLAAGPIRTANDQPCGAVVRFNLDGSVDTNFVTALSGDVQLMETLADKRILVAGTFGGTNLLLRLEPNGAADAGFAPVEFAGTGPNSLVIESNGVIWVAGGFPLVNGQPQTNLARISPSGRPDPGFLPPSGVRGAQVLALEKDGRLLVGGSFTNVFGLPAPSLVRIRTTPDSVPAPRLQFQVLESGRLHFVLPQGHFLEATTNLLDGPWMTVTGDPGSTNESNAATIREVVEEPDQPVKFFRLHLP